MDLEVPRSSRGGGTIVKQMKSLAMDPRLLRRYSRVSLIKVPLRFHTLGALAHFACAGARQNQDRQIRAPSSPKSTPQEPMLGPMQK